jgi:hypothetical protein
MCSQAAPLERGLTLLAGGEARGGWLARGLAAHGLALAGDGLGIDLDSAGALGAGHGSGAPASSHSPAGVSQRVAIPGSVGGLWVGRVRGGVGSSPPDSSLTVVDML